MDQEQVGRHRREQTNSELQLDIHRAKNQLCCNAPHSHRVFLEGKLEQNENDNPLDQPYVRDRNLKFCLRKDHQMGAGARPHLVCILATQQSENSYGT